MGLATEHRRLWQAVILQAVRDLDHNTSPVIKGRTRYEYQRAEHDRRIAAKWFRQAGASFREVCSNAGIDPGTVHSAYVSGKLQDVSKLLKNFSRQSNLDSMTETPTKLTDRL